MDGKYIKKYTQMDHILKSKKYMDLFHKPMAYEQHVQTSSKKKIIFIRHEYGQVGVFRIRIRSLVQKL